jgi:hypothetical protein
MMEWKVRSAQGIRDEIMDKNLNKHRATNGGVSNDSSQALTLTISDDT